MNTLPYGAERPVYLSINNLTKFLSGRKVLNKVSFELYGGEVLGFLGPNGSGKTTTIKSILGLLKIDSGKVSIMNFDVEKDFEKAIINVGAIIENPEFYKYLSGMENLRQFARAYGNITKERIDEVVSLVRLKDRIYDKVSTYSLGMRQRLGLAQVLLHYPKIIILDEPTNGLDPAGIKELRDILRDLSENYGVSAIVSSHQLFELEQICDRVVFIDKGVVKGSRLMSELTSIAEDLECEVVIESKDKELIFNLLNKLGYSIHLEGDKLILVSKTGSIPEITKIIIENGLSFVSINPRKKTLEDVYLSVTKNFTEGGVGQ